MSAVTDILVIGGGLAGLSALTSAAESGASGVLLERTASLGGSTVLSSGLMAFAGTDEQASAGIEDDVERLRHDLLETGRFRNDESLVDEYCAKQLDTYSWLKALGVQFGVAHAGSGKAVPRSHPVDTASVIDTLGRHARVLGAEIRCNVRVRRLLVEGEQVVGVRAEIGDDEVDVRAGAVVLASGGFTQSEELLERFAPAMEHALRAGGAGNTGDGLLMAAKVGAGLADMAFVKGTFGIFPWRSAAEEGTGILAVYKGAIAVNGYGERFINESLPYKVMGDACLAQPEALAFQIFDENVLVQSDASVPIYNFRRRLEAGQVRRADTLEELAEQLGIPADALCSTVTGYNQRLRDGAPDALGRTTLCGGVGKPTPLDTPPYYGFPSTTVVLATYCGVRVDNETRVLDVFGTVIPGLYAAGEVTGGFHGDGYVTGSSLGKSAVFGRIAGRRATAFALGSLTSVAR